jgi:phosphatidylinositol-3-phosphatase
MASTPSPSSPARPDLERLTLRYRPAVPTAIAFVCVLALTGCSSGPASPPAQQVSTTAQAGTYCEGGSPGHAPPRPTKVVIIMGENRSAGEVADSPDAAFQHALSDQCGSLGNMHNETHGSESNYLALVSGNYPRWALCDYPPANSTPGCRFGPSGMIAGPSLFGQLEQAYGAKGWRTYAESMGTTNASGTYVPADCQRFDGVPYVDPEGQNEMRYVARHNPAVYFASLTSCGAYDVPLGDLATDQGAFFVSAASGDLPTVSLVIPDDADNSHDTQLRNYDDFLSQTVGFLASTQDYRTGKLVVIITYDEGDVADSNTAFVGQDCASPDVARDQPSCQIPSWVVGRYVPHMTDDQFETHYSILKSIELWAGLPLLGHAADAGTASLNPRLLITAP